MTYHPLGTSGLRVSDLFLGTMTFGEDWGWGASPEACRAMFDAYAEAGGNVVDTAINYTNGSSERIVGDLLEADRDRFVLSSKDTLTTDPTDPNATLGFPHDFLRETASFVDGTAGRDVVPRGRSRPNPGSARDGAA